MKQEIERGNLLRILKREEFDGVSEGRVRLRVDYFNERESDSSFFLYLFLKTFKGNGIDEWTLTIMFM